MNIARDTLHQYSCYRLLGRCQMSGMPISRELVPPSQILGFFGLLLKQNLIAKITTGMEKNQNINNWLHLDLPSMLYICWTFLSIRAFCLVECLHPKARCAFWEMDLGIILEGVVSQFWCSQLKQLFSPFQSKSRLRPFRPLISIKPYGSRNKGEIAINV